MGRLLRAFGTVEAAWAALDSGDGATVRAVVGEQASRHLALAAMREVVDLNRQLMRMHVDLPVPHPETTRLPLELAAMRRALLERGINLGPSLWALTGGARPVTDDELVFVREPWVFRRGPRARRDPTPGQLALF